MNHKRLIKYFIPFISRFVLASICMAIFSAFAGATMWFIKTIFDRIFISKDIHILYWVVILIPVAFAIKGIVGYGQNYLLYYITQNIIRKIRDELYEKVITLSHDFYTNTSSARIMSIVTNDVMLLQSAIFRVPLMLIRDGLTIIVMIGILFYLHWKFALIALIIFPIAGIPLNQFARKMRNASREGQKQMAELNLSLQESLNGINIIKVFLQEKNELERFTKEDDKYYHAQQKLNRVDARSSPTMEFIGAVAIAFVLWYGGNDVIKGVWSSGAFLSFLGAVASAYAPIRNFAQTNTLIQQSFASSERIFELLDHNPTVMENENAIKIEDFKSEIRYENVTFSYIKQTDVISDLNLSIKKGEIIAIVGPSGSGKTSLINLLLRFYDPQQGRILIDGQDIKNMKFESLRSKIGVVTQEVFLFNESVKFNIAYGKKDADENEIINAAIAANAHSFIMKMPQGYDSMIGERGVKLSGGERQRISIARAMLKNPPILVLDEATSSLDAESEKLVQDAIEKLMANRTVIIIAHRLATVKKADRIIVLDKGVIVEQGNHNELLKNEGVYSRLHNLQLL